MNRIQEIKVPGMAKFFRVYDGDENIILQTKSHSEAWRAFDRLEGEIVNKSEDRSDFAFKRQSEGWD